MTTLETMGENMQLSLATTVTMVILLALRGIAMSQERSMIVDTGVIFSAQQVERSPNLRWVKAMGVTPPFWTPSLEDIALAERQLKSYMEALVTPQAKELTANLASYKRQYVGYTERDKKLIFINGICKRYWQENESNLRELVTIRLDGGSCFFTARYDPSLSQVDMLFINGEG